MTWTDAGDDDIDAAEGTVSFMDTTSGNLPIFSVGSDHYAFKGGELVPVTRDDDGGYSDPQNWCTEASGMRVVDGLVKTVNPQIGPAEMENPGVVPGFTSMKLFQLTTV